MDAEGGLRQALARCKGIIVRWDLEEAGVTPTIPITLTKYDKANAGSYYTTCLLTTDASNVITYSDPGAGTPPDGNNVVSMSVDGVSIDFTDTTTTYLVSTVN